MKPVVKYVLIAIGSFLGLLILIGAVVGGVIKYRRRHHTPPIITYRMRRPRRTFSENRHFSSSTFYNGDNKTQFGGSVLEDAYFRGSIETKNTDGLLWISIFDVPQKMHFNHLILEMFDAEQTHLLSMDLGEISLRTNGYNNLASGFAVPYNEFDKWRAVDGVKVLLLNQLTEQQRLAVQPREYPRPPDWQFHIQYNRNQNRNDNRDYKEDDIDETEVKTNIENKQTIEEQISQHQQNLDKRVAAKRVELQKEASQIHQADAAAMQELNQKTDKLIQHFETQRAQFAAKLYRDMKKAEKQKKNKTTLLKNDNE